GFDALEARELLAVVTLGSVSGLTEGFGFGSTIDGFGSALNLTAGRFAKPAAFAQPIGISQTRAFTQEYWLYPQANASGELYQLQGNGILYGVAKVLNAGRDVQFTGLAGDVTVSNVLNPNAWNHVAETFDGTDLDVFVNGVEVFTSTAFVGARLPEPT